ncbi:MAG: glycoside hydrolase family 16 protein [Verrucomicrobia bacterium]|nr:glycoside hydrolase family 16 protein [Verrucomicrobiota bacterium]
MCWILGVGVALGADTPVPPVEKPGWKLTFQDEFDRPQLNDMYWFAAYRSGRKEYFKRIGKPSRWTDHNAHYVIEDGILKLRIDEKLPYRPNKSTPCVSCVQTSDHRFGATTNEFQILDKFAQKYGWFEIRCRCARGRGLLSAFWLHQHDPTKQEYTPEGRRKNVGDGVVEIDIIEQMGKEVDSGLVDLNVHFTKDAHHRYRQNFDPSKEFHVWAMEWQEGRINWYLDGKVVKTYKGPTPQEKMFILLSLFQYAGWIGEIDPNLTYPRDFEVDYVRVYARETK